MNKVNRVSTYENMVATPVVAQTATYKPISNAELDTLTKNAITANGFILADTKYLIAKEGKQAVGNYFLNYGNDPDISILVAWQNSYDKVVTVKFVVGCYVFVCSNGMCIGDMGTYKHKHTGDVQEVTPETISNFLKNASKIFDQMVADKEVMKSIDLTSREVAELLGRMYIEESIITCHQLGAIKKQLTEPAFDYGTKDTMWNLMNHITFALKEAHPQHWLRQHIDSYRFLKSYNADKYTDLSIEVTDIADQMQIEAPSLNLTMLDNNVNFEVGSMTETYPDTEEDISTPAGYGSHTTSTEEDNLLIPDITIQEDDYIAPEDLDDSEDTIEDSNF